jgi:hypothetical protein
MPFSWFKIDVSQIPLASLSGCACKCLLALASIMDDQCISSCSYSSLCHSICISRRSAMRAIKELEDSDLLTRCFVPGQVLRVQFKRACSVGRHVDPSALPSGHVRDWTPPRGATNGT